MKEGFKVCSKCHLEKKVGEFYACNRRGKKELWASCKTCATISANLWKQNNLELAKKRAVESSRRWRLKYPEKAKEALRIYKLKYPDRTLAATRKWRSNHPEEQKEATRKWRTKHIERFNRVNSIWKKNNPDRLRISKQASNKKIRSTLRGNLDHRMSSMVRKSLCEGKNGREWETLVGYNAETLKKHLESLFTKGMTWDLFLQGKIHIDHIWPLSRLYIDGVDDPTFRFAWSLKNLQPLWAEDNKAKADKITNEWKKAV